MSLPCRPKRCSSSRPARLTGWPHCTLAKRACKRFFFEEVRRHASTDASHVYGGFLGLLTAFAEHHQIPYQGVPVGTIKKHATGKGNANKDAMVAAMRALGHQPADDNEADALALLHWAIAQEGARA
jgi:Holliday junction resolvasome RuvABC endonuclease subunit